MGTCKKFILNEITSYEDCKKSNPEIMTKIEIKDVHYLVDGKKYVRVTKVLDIIAKPEFYRWYAKFGFDHCERVKDRRASFGTKFHKYVQLLLSGQELNWIAMDDEMFQTMNLFTKWASKHDIKPLFLEKHLIDNCHLVGGTADFAGKFDGKKVLIDWKTAKKIYPSYYLQIAAYVAIYEDMYNCILDGAYIFCFRDGKVTEEFISHKELEEYYDLFLCALRLWRWKFG